MKTGTASATVKKAGVIILTALLIASAVNAQNKEIKFNDKAVKNLILGIQHENEGIKKDAVYFAAVYGITEAIPTLIEELKKEKNPKIRLLIALSLYKLGDTKGIEAVYEAASNDSDAKVRRICNAIVREYSSIQKEVALGR